MKPLAHGALRQIYFIIKLILFPILKMYLHYELKINRSGKLALKLNQIKSGKGLNATRRLTH